MGHYEILDLLGEGAMGVVYRARDTRLQRDLALKFLRAGGVDEHDRQRFVHEARAAARLSHPNVAAVYDIGEIDGELFIAMEYVRGGTLRDRLAQLPIGRALDVAIQVARGLAAAHAAGIVNRDLKPENVLLRDEDGTLRAQITDFGVARLADATRVTQVGTSLGTIGYMSPEQLRGEVVDGRSDIFAAGVLLFELMTGQRPFPGDHAAAVMYAIAHDAHEPASHVRAGVPAALDDVIARCLAKDPVDRFASASELASALEAVRAGLPSTGTPAVRLSRRGPAGRARRRIVAGVAAGAILAIATLIVAQRSRTVDSLAVLPFANAADTSVEYMSDGMTESLIDALSRLPHLKVIARSSVYALERRNLDPREAGRRLGVKAILTGQVVQRDGAVVVTAELIDARDDRHLWGGRYSRPPAELASLTPDLLADLSGRLGLRGAAARSAGRERHVPDPDAYHLFLRAQHAWNQQSNPQVRVAANYYRQAIARDPRFAAAYAGLANTDWYLSTVDFPPREAAALTRADAARALALDDGLADAHVAMAQVMSYFDWNWEGADREYRKAIECKPALALAHSEYAYFLFAMRRPDEAGPHARLAHELDPLSASAAMYAKAQDFYRRRYDAFIREVKPIADADSTNFPAHYWLGFAYDAAGRLDAAIAELRLGYRLDGDPMELAMVGKCQALAGNRDSALAIRSVLAAREDVSPFAMAKLYVGLDDHPQALALLERAVRDGDSSIEWLGVDPDFDPLRSEPRFRALLHSLRFAG